MEKMVEIDGSFGEGGGQILRTSLTMSLITGIPFRITKIRAKRSNPGLAPQHLAAVESAVKISGSKVEGAEVKSQELTFIPETPQPGNYCLEVHTAGAMTLVFQTVVFPLAFRKQKCRVDFYGGTHVSWAPPYEYLEMVWGNVARAMGLNVTFGITKAGFYPKGGGHFYAEISPVEKILPLHTTERQALDDLEAICVFSMLPSHVPDRELSNLERYLKTMALPVRLKLTEREYPSNGTGNMLFLKAKMGQSFGGFSCLGERGKPSEAVAKDVAKSFEEFWKTNACVEEHLADQLLIPLSFAQKPSSYKVSKISEHLLTNADVIRLFRNVDIKISGQEGETGIVEVIPRE